MRKIAIWRQRVQKIFVQNSQNYRKVLNSKQYGNFLTSLFSCYCSTKTQKKNYEVNSFIYLKYKVGKQQQTKKLPVPVKIQSTIV